METKISKIPFPYKIIDNFLGEDDFSKIVALYSEMKFKELKSDLFSFLQTNEINDKAIFLTDKIQKEIDSSGIEYSKDGLFYTVFSSYYRKNDYLLCHDDCIDSREIAFTFYLEDFIQDSMVSHGFRGKKAFNSDGKDDDKNSCGGELVLYENDCETTAKIIPVKKNRLVLFRVTENSFHEVKRCLKDGRKAITGWLNSKSRKLGHKEFGQKHEIPAEASEVELPLEVENLESFLSLDFSALEESEVSRRISGPFVDRRVTKINTEDFLTYKIQGLRLVSAEYLSMGPDSYILCNDKINALEGDIFDLFIFKSDCKEFIYYVNSQGKIKFKIDAEKGQLLLGPRKDHKLYIPRPPQEVLFYHLIYIKQ